MTLRTIVYVDTDVIEYRIRKRHSPMACRTILGCRYVITELAQSNHIVMA